MAFFVQAAVLPHGVCRRECKAFLALTDILDMLVATPLGMVTAPMLRATTGVFLQACLDAGWEAWMHTKFHWLVRNTESFTPAYKSSELFNKSLMRWQLRLHVYLIIYIRHFFRFAAVLL